MKKKIFSFLTVCLLAVAFLASCTKKYTVDFEEDGGSEVAAVVVTEGELLELTETPTKEDFTFGGWYLDPNCLEEFDETAPVTADMILYAKWVVTLSFNTNGGSEVKAIVGEPGAAVQLPDAPVKDGHVFAGWYTSATFEKEQTYLLPDKNATAYAKWLVVDKGSVMPVSGWVVNDAPHYTRTDADGAMTLTATAEKGSYSFVKSMLAPFGLKGCNAVSMTVKGPKGEEILLKLEGGSINNEAGWPEQVFKFTGEEQTIVWVLDNKILEKACTGNEMLMFFLFPGKEGATEGSVTIKSTSICRLVDSGKENDNSTIYFNTNGAANIEPIVAAKGSAVTAPADPEREGFVFKGWYTDEACTQAYTFDKMPNEAVELFAKWDMANGISLNVITDTYAQLDPDTYEFAYANGVLSVKKTGTGEWQFAKGALTGAAIKGMTLLKVEIKGVAGQKITFKINDQFEQAVECDGTVQTKVFDFSHLTINENAPALLMFVNGGVAAASEVFEITRLEFANYLDNLNVIEDTYAQLDPDTYEFAYANGVLSVKKTGTGEWQFAKGALTGAAIKGYKKLIVEIKGVAGQKITFKINDQFEQAVECDGTVQTKVFDFSHLTINENAPALLMFVNGGVAAASEVFEITRLEFAAVNDPLSVLEDTYAQLDPDTYEFAYANGVLSAKKTGTGEWQFAKGTLTGAAIKGYTTLTVTVKGVAGQKITFKINDQLEKAVECDGTVQTLVFDFSNVKVNENAPALLMFINGGVAAASEVFEITQLTFGN